MKYYVKKEWDKCLEAYAYRAYEDSEYVNYIPDTWSKTLAKLQKKMNIVHSHKPEELGEFDTEVTS
jgi:hypothetical protein